MEMSIVEESFNIIKYQNGTSVPCSEVSLYREVLYKGRVPLYNVNAYDDSTLWFRNNMFV